MLLKCGDIMEITLILDMKLTREQEAEFIENRNSFFKNNIDIKNVDKNDYQISLVDTDLKPYSKYGFPRDMVEWLYSHKIYRLEYISDFTYVQIKESQINNTNRFKSHSYMEYLTKLIETMKKYNLRFKDIEIDDLIPIREVELCTRAINSLKCNDLFYMQDISCFTRDEVSDFRNLGEKTQREIEEVMLKCGIGYKTGE